jgi:hypothetical protein
VVERAGLRRRTPEESSAERRSGTTEICLPILIYLFFSRFLLDELWRRNEAVGSMAVAITLQVPLLASSAHPRRSGFRGDPRGRQRAQPAAHEARNCRAMDEGMKEQPFARSVKEVGDAIAMSAARINRATTR